MGGGNVRGILNASASGNTSGSGSNSAGYKQWRPWQDDSPLKSRLPIRWWNHVGHGFSIKYAVVNVHHPEGVADMTYEECLKKGKPLQPYCSNLANLMCYFAYRDPVGGAPTRLDYLTRYLQAKDAKFFFVIAHKTLFN